ncbi:pentapeptide repeat-containing protein [Anabaena catenula]|uniref:Pentapeptide repeat-containing protein n=1 Tax=Anabaena catenula FACHB-362 TaxID=2692877 RepID=A0ABR8IZ09_9NOST|nr:pentapeptide repeat-containing protein [Anabaena catenula]MBD2691329.1 pentapeptide repeat-containing protein [Anabaena catenula FACHB-362]
MANSEHLDILQQGLEAWNNWRDENPDTVPDFSNFNFFEANLRYANFSRANFSGANLGDAILNYTNFSEADLTGCNLSHANFNGADLSRANLNHTAFYITSLCDADLSGANLSHATFYNTDLSGANLSHSNLTDADLSKCHFEDTNLSGADLSGANLSQADFYNTNFSGANLRGANLVRSNLWVDFTDADLYDVESYGFTFDETNFNGANLSGTNLSYAFFSRANLSGVNLSDANLSYAVISGANLRYANLNNANLSFSQVIATNFNHANITGACIKNWNINHKTKLNGVICDYIYLDVNEKERRPIKGNFEPGKFDIFCKKIIDSKNLIVSKIFEDDEVNNQGLELYLNQKSCYWENLRFHSEAEIKIAQALDRAGVLYLPNCLARLNTNNGRANKEANFLVRYKGNWGILEVDEIYYTPERRTEEQERERMFKRNGIKVVERFDPKSCYDNPDMVVKEFLEVIENIYS